MIQSSPGIDMLSVWKHSTSGMQSFVVRIVLMAKEVKSGQERRICWGIERRESVRMLWPKKEQRRLSEEACPLCYSSYSLSNRKSH